MSASIPSSETIYVKASDIWNLLYWIEVNNAFNAFKYNLEWTKALIKTNGTKIKLKCAYVNTGGRYM